MDKENNRCTVNLLLMVLFLAGTVLCEEVCLPDAGISGDLESVVLRVETWKTLSSNFHTSDPERTSVDVYNIAKSAGVVSVVEGAKVRFYGQELCIALTKITELEKADGSVDRSSVCHRTCIGVGSGTRLDSYSGSGGKPTSTNPPCCYWGRRIQLRFSIPAAPTTPPPAYKCPDCTGCDEEKDVRLVTCDTGDQCFTLKTQMTKDSEVVVIKGCSSKLRYWGDRLDCDYGCKNNVPLSKEYGNYRYSVCVACCKGDECNVARASGSVGLKAQFLMLVLAVVMWIL